MSERVLVTGASGFLGHFVVDRLLAAGHSVTALCNSSVPDAPAGADVDWVRLDLCAPLDTFKLPAKVDRIIHLAQSPQYRNGPAGEEHVFAVNVAALSGLLRYAEHAGATGFVSASTGSVYEPFHMGLNESSPVSPTGFYGASKLAAEHLANAYRDRFTIANLRVFFLYGPGQRDMLIARLIENIRAGKTCQLPERGHGLVFCPTFVEDTAAVFAKAAEQAWSGTYNVASPYPVDFEKLLLTIAETLNTTVTIERGGSAQPTPILPSLDKLSAKFDLSQFHTIEEGLKKTV